MSDELKDPDGAASTPCPAAGGCGLTTRRGFLRASTGCAVSALALLGLPAGDALALPVLAVEGVQSGAERRYPIPAADGVSVDRAAQTILVRAQGHVYVFALSCPHENAAVKWLPKDNRFQCTKHDSKYRPDGLYMSGRSTRNLDRFAIRRDEQSVVVDLNHLYQSDKDPAGWAAAAIGV
jgi:nitrite reductase/ring-hydroxylating ferredoxin subunit